MRCGLAPKRFTATLFALSCLVSAELLAGELIFDPENPGLQEVERETREPRSELIFDPENKGEESPEEATSRVSGGESSSTLWKLNYEAAALVHPGIGPAGQDPLELLTGLGAELRHDLTPRLNLVLAGRFHYWAGAGEHLRGWRTEYEPRLELAYLNYRSGRWSVSVGQRHESWGSTDLIRPGDVIDPVDLRHLSGGGLGSTLSQLSASAAYSTPKWSLRAVLVPFFQPNRIALFGRDTALASARNPIVGEQLPFLLLAEELLDPSIQQGIQPFLQATERPQELPLNASLGLRGAWTVAGADLALSAFYGWDRTPEVELDDDMRELLTIVTRDGQLLHDLDFISFIVRNPRVLLLSHSLWEKAQAGETLFASRYRRRLTILADFARYFGPIGVRADIAFSPRRVFYTTELQAQYLPSLFSAFGLSYEHLSDDMRPLAVILEGFWLHPFRSGDDGERSSELLLFEDGYYGVAGALTWHLPWLELEAQAGGVMTISPGDMIAQIRISRRFTSALEVKLGANFFIGPDPKEALSLGGAFAQNNRLYLALGGQF